MKKKLLLLFAMTFISWNVANAALPDGADAQDWTLTDLNSNVYNLYTYLNAGTPVIIDFSATWCGPCWSYHNTGILENLYDSYGPSGSNELMVFFIEPDASTNTDCLYGLSSCVGGTTGNWVAGTPYPIIDLIGSNLSVASDYNVTYYPTLYGISPDARTWEVGQASQSTWENWMFQSFALDATGAVTDAACGNNGAIDMTPTGGYGSISYNWSNGDSGPNISDLTTGIYMVTISDGNGYYIEKEFTVNGPASGQGIGLDIISLTDIDCNGNATGQAHVEGTFGNYGYSYEWSNGDTGPVAYNLYAGDHQVSITDAANCTEEFTVTVNEPEVLFSYPIESGDACGNGTGEVFFVPLGGTSPYFFDIGNGPEPTDAFFDLPAGVYNYTHTDANNCSFSSTFEIELVGIPTAVAAAATDLDCTNTTVTVSGNGSSTGGDYDYLWTTTNGNITSDPTSLDIIVDEPGDYNLEITNTNYGCVESAAASVIETVSPPNSDAGQPSTVSCNVPQITLDGSASDMGPDYTYLWTTTDGNIVSGADGLTPIVDAVGTYTLAVTNNANGCISTSDVVVPGDFTQPAITTTDGEITCASTMVEICATVDPGVTVKWTTPDGEVTANCIMVSAAGSYTATAVGANGCNAVATSMVTQSADIPQTQIETPAMITCAEPQVQLEASLTGSISDHTIVWTTSNGNIVSGENTLTPTVDQGGAYVLSVTNNTNGCASQATTTVDSDISLPAAGFTFNANIGTLSLTNTSSNNDGNVSWDLGNGETAEGDIVEVSYDETGIYTICVTVNNECGSNVHCEDIQFVTVMSFAGSLKNIDCNGNSNGEISVTPNGGLPAYEVAWSGPNGFVSDQLTISGLAPGDYTMNLSDNGGNMATESYTITEPTELLMTAASTDVSCFGGNDGSVILTVSGGTAPYTNDFGNGVDPDNLPAGSYTLTSTDDNGCIVQLVEDITQPDELIISSVESTDANAGQANGSITIVPGGGTGNIEVTWDNGSTGTTIDGLEAGMYTPTLTDENGCEVTLDPIEVKSISSIGDLDFVNSFLLSPNPASNLVNLEVGMNKVTSVVISIQNTIGQRVYQQEHINTTSINTLIDVNNYDSGLYILTLTSGNSHATHKFIVVK